MTDNAWAHRWSLRNLCATTGIKQIFIRPHCPWQNGKVERLNRTLLTEWAYRQVFLANPWNQPDGWVPLGASGRCVIAPPARTTSRS